MSVQTTVLENGRWVTRSVDPYHVRAQNTGTPRKEQSQPSINLPKTPSLGILTKTLVRSSVVNQIIPARIRHKTKNDVLFISANSVSIKEAKGDYTLREITTKSGFDSKIKSARIIGERRELTKRDVSYRLLEKNENRQYIHTNEASNHVDEDNVTKELPPHILVLALESNRLVFLCAISGTSERPKFFSSQKALPAPTSPLQGLGELIAVDPRSRAMAVAAFEGRAYLYTLKSMHEMREEFREKSHLGPIKEEKLILLDGSIVKMEFLYPPEDESNRIILLFIVSVAGRNKSHLIWYDWNADVPLHQSQLKQNKLALHPDEQLPLLLIPLLKNTAFILVCEKCMVLIKDILTGSFHRFIHRLAAEQEPQEPGISMRRPLWVQWARPMRSKELRHDEDYIVLCREDGIVQYMEIHHGIKQMIDSNHNVGRLGININTSFATVDLGAQTEDLLIAGGDESDGGIWDFPPRQTIPNQRGIISNWTPINDFAVANVPIDRQGAGITTAANNASKAQQRLFACVGRGKHGAISELRYGVEASKKITTLGLDDGLEKSVLGIWALHGSWGKDEEEREEKYLKDATYIILSHPLRTDLLLVWLKQNPEPSQKQKSESIPKQNPGCIPKQNSEDDGGLLEADVYSIGDDVGLDLNARTIAAGRTSQGRTFQITETSFRATWLPEPHLLKEEGIKEEDTENRKSNEIYFDHERLRERYAYSFGDSRVLAACMHTAANSTITVLACHRDGQFYLEFGTFTNEYRPFDQRIPLHAQPSCLSLLKTENEILVLVGTLGGELEVFLLDNVSSGLLIPTNTIRHAFTGPFGICDSIATISKATSQGVHPLLVCGLRDGTVETLNMTKGVSTYHLSLCEKLAFGYTSVTVLKDTTTNRAIIQCETTLCTLEYNPSDHKDPATVRNVWITDPSAPSLQQGKISAINQVVNSWQPGGSSGFTAESFVCIDGDRLHTVSLDSQPKLVPRRLRLGGNPIRVLYSVYLDKLIVLHNKLEVFRGVRTIDGQPRVGGKRALRPMVSFLDYVEPVSGPDPDAMDIDDLEKPNDSQALMISECKPGEKCLGITEWFPKPKAGENPHHLLIINTTLIRAGKPVGRLLIFQIRIIKDQPPKLVFKKAIDTEEPVYTVATYPEKSLIYCCGNDLYMQSIGVADQSRFHLQTPAKLAMRSPGRHITVKEPYIYVSSSRESLSVYRFDAGQLIYQFGDQSARDGLHHLQIPSQSLVLASDMSDTVVGLWQPPERRIDNAMTTVFEAVLPTSITRLRRIIPPMWSHTDHEYHESRPENLYNPPGLRSNETILGSSADGTLTQMSILSSEQWRLLRFVQNMAERHPLICPFHPGNPHRRRIEPSDARPHYMHVNGDILDRTLERGSGRLLNEMLDVEPDHESHTDFGTKEERRERFEELAKDVLVADVKGAEAVGMVVLCLRYLLRSAL